ncbi:hypothetical protein M758_1G151700 [Ceratodon purpureus]|uniref:F-box domain-containing protein n=1 Tax=Ceratodon purpureus TaxID=3225 RepID=A0A8T0J6D3_CERPU|nr:hypothetical protein KC19_1G154500 [Ceratodon purpureus]KAG0591167.1 hypothetical protein KC19_1G155100 [Ceratodon purpureus]KAG0630067.1 hypothetical protein M758_1G151700 [Ceratodon purpureus]
MQQGDTMVSKRGISDMLPVEIIERALSFLSVPELCRMRSVCKEWKEIIGRPSFHDLCDLNGRKHAYLFMWSIEPPRLFSSPILQDTLRFLDLNAKLWYSIPASSAGLPRVCPCGHEVESRYKSTNSGLVCELTTLKDTGGKMELAICDPLAKSRRMLPTPPQIFVSPNDDDNIVSVASLVVSAKIVTVVDYTAGNYKVFLLNNLSHTAALRAQPRMYVHESFTNEWRALENLPNGVEGSWAYSAVVLHESLFILQQHDDHFFTYRLSLYRYRFKENTWAEVYHMYFPRNVNFSRLVVGGDSLFLNVSLGGPRSSDPSYNRRFADPGLKSDPDCPDPGEFFEYPHFPDTDTCFEMYEILIDDHRRKPVVQLTLPQLQQIFGGDGAKLAVSCTGAPCVGSIGIPCVDSNGICNSVIMAITTHSRGFRLRRYDLATGSVDVLPPHPLVQRLQKRIGDFYTGNVENMKLSLRNLLAQSPKQQVSSEWRLLQERCPFHG